MEGLTTAFLNLTNLTNSSCIDDAKEKNPIHIIVFAIVAVVISSVATTFGLFFQKIAQQRFINISDYKKWNETSQEKDGEGGSDAKRESTEDALLMKKKGEMEIQHPSRIFKDDDKLGTGGYRGRTWLCWAGGLLAITLFSFGLDLFAMGILGQSVVVPLLASLEVAENQIFAPIFLGETFVPVYDVTAPVIIVAGALLTTLFGPPPSKESSCDPPEDVMLLFTKVPFIIFGVVTAGLTIACCSMMYIKKFNKIDKIRFLMFAYVCGFLGGIQNVFLKGMGVGLNRAFNGEAAAVFSSYKIYFFVLCMLTLALTQLIILNQGLARFPALIFVPSYTVLYIFMGTAAGMIFYEEYKTMKIWPNWIWFIVGCVLIVVALVILTLKKEPDAKKETNKNDRLRKNVHKYLIVPMPFLQAMESRRKKKRAMKKLRTLRVMRTVSKTHPEAKTNSVTEDQVTEDVVVPLSPMTYESNQ